MISLGEKADATRTYTTGFDTLRLLLAVSILCFHSVLVTRGTDVAAWHWPYRPVSSLMLPMFFALSGYLVAGSFFRTATLAQFLALRVLRIVPALFVEVVLCALILGPAVTALPLSDYFTAREFLTYGLNVIGRIHYLLPGVFHENPLPVVNLSLWTVPFELECYIGLTILAAVTLLHRPKLLLIAFAVLSITAIAWQAHIGFLWSRPDGRTLVITFLAGVLCYVWRYKIPHSIVALVASALLSLILLCTPQTAILAALPITYITIFFGLTNAPRIPLLSRGDYSYGIYLYAFPMQQLQAYLLPAHRIWWVNILFALPATAIWAAMSWHVIEQPVLSRKKQALMFVARIEKWISHRIWQRAKLQFLATSQL